MPAVSLDEVYMNITKEIARLSYAERTKVGAVIVKDNSIISYGYNGTPYGQSNICEIDNVTKASVIHAEVNAISKAAKSGISTDRATMYILLAPCVECAKFIIQSGISEVIYLDNYKNMDGLNLLQDCQIKIKKLEKNI